MFNYTTMYAPYILITKKSVRYIYVYYYICTVNNRQLFLLSVYICKILIEISDKLKLHLLENTK